MKLSEVVREYIELKIEGEPKPREWSSWEVNHHRKQVYLDKLKELEAAIDGLQLCIQA
jgi:hypothetical protein